MTKITIGTLIDTVTITKKEYDRLMKDSSDLAWVKQIINLDRLLCDTEDQK